MLKQILRWIVYLVRVLNEVHWEAVSLLPRFVFFSAPDSVDIKGVYEVLEVLVLLSELLNAHLWFVDVLWRPL